MGGRPRLSDRAALTGILFVLRSGLPWEMLPAEMGCGSGMSCWRRVRDWHEAGVWASLHQVLLERLHVAGQIVSMLPLAVTDPGPTGSTQHQSLMSH